jgi:hypothetical protein
MSEPTVPLEGQGLVCLEVHFRPAAANPARIFRGIAEFITALETIDRDMVRVLEPGYKVVLTLDRVEAGSLKVWLRTVLQRIPDEALLNLDVKPLLGQFLVKWKQLLLRWANAHQTVTSTSDINDLAGQLRSLELATLGSSAMAELPKDRLLEHLRLLARAVQTVEQEDRVVFSANGESITISSRFRVTLTHVEPDVVRPARSAAPARAESGRSAVAERRSMLPVVAGTALVVLLVVVVAYIVLSYLFGVPEP